MISEDVEEDFYRLVAGGATGSPLPGISVFGTVAGALMDNPVPYSKVFGSLLRSVQLLAQYRTSTSSWKPPYALISKDIQQTGRLLGLRDAAVDGLRVAAHLLVPSEKALQETPGNTGTSLPINAGSFRNIDRSIQLAKSLDFPWDIPGCLRGFMGLITGTDPSSLHRDKEDDTSLATQILALVWYRYYAFENMQGGPQASPETIKLGLRQQAGHLASSPVVESYVSILEQASGQQGIGLRRNIFIVGNVPDLSPNLVHELKRHGFRTVEVANLEETEHLCNRQAPDAVLVNHDSFPEQTLKFGWSAMKDRQGAGPALFALTESSEPSLIMNLMESGFSDVFAPPFNAAVLVARISKTLAIVTRKGESASGRQGFSATFNELSFTDLIQALAGGGKSVRILLERPTGEKADIYMRTGQIVHAACGKVSGIEAVYEVISWHNDGSFRVVPATQFPPDTISTSNDYILLEGCRRLDEAGG